MFKTAMKRGAFSFPIGVSVSQLVNILISFIALYTLSYLEKKDRSLAHKKF